MKEKTTIELFEHYVHYWIVNLELHKKYNFIIKKDNRINCYAYVQKHATDDKIFYIKFNASRLKYRYQILAVVLHELGHLLYDFRYTDEVAHEYSAEYFSLSTAKIHYPNLYPRMVQWTKSAIKKKSIDKVHKDAYIKALTELGEL